VEIRAEDTNAIASVSLGENPGNAVPFQKIVVLPRPPPVTTRRKLKPPATAVFGEMELMEGVPGVLVILKVRAAEVPPPGAGLKTVTGAVLPNVKFENWANSVEERMTVSWVGLTNVVGRFIPFHCTNEPRKKPDPFTVNTVSGLKRGADVGDIELSTGAGLFASAGGGLCHKTEVPLPVASLCMAPHIAPFVGDDWIPMVAPCPKSCNAQSPPKTASL